MDLIETDAKTPITAKVGTEFHLVLPGWEIQGCEWTLTPSAPLVREIAHGYGPEPEAAKRHVVGPEAPATFTFSAIAPGACLIDAVCRPTYGDTSQVVASKQFRIVVQGAAN